MTTKREQYSKGIQKISIDYTKRNRVGTFGEKVLNSVCSSENLQLLSEAEKKLYVSNILPYIIQDILRR